MNQELIKQASVAAERFANEQYPEQDAYGRPYQYKLWENARSTKFAELIVKECTDTIDDVGSGDSEMRGYGNYFVAKINELFGVK